MDSDTSSMLQLGKVFDRAFENSLIYTKSYFLQALVLLQLLGFVFLPVYIASKASYQRFCATDLLLDELCVVKCVLQENIVRKTDLIRVGLHPTGIHDEEIWRPED